MSKLKCPSLRELPSPPPQTVGWPWTDETPALPVTMPDGEAWPRISIVTPSFNQGQFIEETIRSVLLQGYPNLEYIIIDGGSTDETVEIIKKYEPWITYSVSEPDKGQTDAINKGIQRCTGDLFNWVNSDDFLKQGALRAIGERYRPGTHVICGVGRLVGECLNGEYVEFGRKGSRLLQEDYKTLAELPELLFQHSNYFHMEIIREFPMSPSMHYAMDLEIWLKYLMTYPTRDIVTFDEVIASFRQHSLAKSGQDDMVKCFDADFKALYIGIAKFCKFTGLARIIDFIPPHDRHVEYEFFIDHCKVDRSVIEKMLHNFIFKYARRSYHSGTFSTTRTLLRGISRDNLNLHDRKSYDRYLFLSKLGPAIVFYRRLKRMFCK